MEPNEVENVRPQLVEALRIVMDSSSSRELRSNANNFIESFKESSPYSVECGFHLVLHESVPVVRHFGLVLIEHCIKYQWNAMNLEKKVFIKDNLMTLLSKGTLNLLDEQYYIKNGLAKTIVEIIKREWPQQWPALLEELFAISTLGETQAELVLIIFLVLAEDVVVLNNAQPQRRRDIYQGLVANLDRLFPFFADLLICNVNKYHMLIAANDVNSELCRKVNCQVASSALETIAEYIDWIQINHLLILDGMLMKIFCRLLVDDKLKFPAVKCILAVTSRKGKASDRVPLLKLFDQECLEPLFQAVSLAEKSAISESNYIFLKNVCQAVFSLGTQLHSIYGAVSEVDLPATFSTYLEAILQLVSHPSIVISTQAKSLWHSFMLHKVISKHPKFLTCIQNLISRAAPKLIKKGFPSRNDCLECSFSQLDFDSDDDFNVSFSKLRSECSNLLRLATELDPNITFTYSMRWLQELINKPIQMDKSINKLDNLCSLRSPYFLEWDALAVCLESVLSRASALENQAFQEEGISLITPLLSCPPEDPLVLSSWLSCVSALFPFVKHSTPVLQLILDAIFRIVVFPKPGQSKSSRSKAVKNVRRHACSCLVKLCKLYPLVFQPFFDQIYNYVKNLSSGSEQLSQLEKCTLIEALILIKNQSKNYEVQSLFIQDVLYPVANVWLSEEIKSVVSSTNNFLRYIGLNEAPVPPSPEDTFGINRSRIIGCLELILAVIKRSAWPEEIELAEKGGFVENNADFGCIFRNPAQNFLFPLYPHVFYLLSVLNQLWLPVNMKMIRPEYVFISEMTDSDKNNLLGIPCANGSDVIATKDTVERFKTFITGVYDSCHSIIGHSGISLGSNFYCAPNLSDYLLFSVCTHLTSIPEHRIRSLIRHLLKPLIQHCPAQSYITVLIRFLKVFCSLMDQKLHKIWTKQNEINIENHEYENEHTEAQEVIEEQLHRHLTREYLDLLTVILLNKISNKSSEMMEEDDLPSSISSESQLSELGRLIFLHKEIYSSIVLCIFDVLMWIDNTSCFKALQLCLPVIKQLVDNKCLEMEEAHYLFRCVLIGLQKHGQHDSNNFFISLGYQAYVFMLPVHPSLSQLLANVCEGAENQIKNLDEILLGQNRNKQVSEKKKKDLFKNLVIGIVEKSVGEIFSRKAIIKNLPKTFRQAKPKMPDVVDLNISQGLCYLFNSKNV